MTERKYYLENAKVTSLNRLANVYPAKQLNFRYPHSKLNFINKHNFEKVVFLLKSSEINYFFEKINADVELYNQILYYKGTTFELILKKNIQNKTDYDKKENLNIIYFIS